MTLMLKLWVKSLNNSWKLSGIPITVSCTLSSVLIRKYHYAKMGAQGNSMLALLLCYHATVST